MSSDATTPRGGPPPVAAPEPAAAGSGDDFETLLRMGAAAVGRSVAAGRLDPRDLTEFCLARAQRAAEGPDAAFAIVTADRARREAQAAWERAREGRRRGLLDGVPITWKDLIDLRGEPTGGGAPRLVAQARPPIAAQDAAVAKRGARAGLVTIGKTHLSELAFSGLGVNPQTATPPNPFDDAAAPGGSSSGAAISVAGLAAAAAVGSDTGGSVRIPAAWCGLVGLKTTIGSVPMDGVIPLSPSLDTLGPLCRTVEDAAEMFALLTGAAAPDLQGAAPDVPRLLAADTVVLDDMSEAAQQGYAAALARLEAAGARVTTGPTPEFAETLALVAADGALVNTEGYAIWRAAIEAAPDALSPLVLARFRSGAEFSAPQIDGVRLQLTRLSGALRRRMGGADAIIAPTTPNRAPPRALIEAGGDAAMRENLLALRNTRLANLLGLCALSLPAGLDSMGAPISVMLIGRPHEEGRLLRIGAALEPFLKAAD